ncbi:hypothetical protein ARMGADRAFT_1038531 [Armillaria gallica]|uniref:Uncharacterized protein n=1 Tax=Armillaria gallica TaxID=47427 RepID=A0A2H3CHQ7_ARMGA|nr:hypothetical protein ARMGADRAFT_1038531 [Armillaria gallica]
MSIFKRKTGTISSTVLLSFALVALSLPTAITVIAQNISLLYSKLIDKTLKSVVRSDNGVVCQYGEVSVRISLARDPCTGTNNPPSHIPGQVEQMSLTIVA